MDVAVKQINLTENKGALQRIWELSFPNDADFAPYFLKNIVDYAECYAVILDCSPICAAYFLKSELSIHGVKWNARYVYGVGTLPEYRKKGYASLLLREAAKSINADVLFLFPATESLRNFYTKSGYSDFFMQKRETLIKSTTFSCADAKSAQFDAQIYCKQRADFLKQTTLSFATFPVKTMDALLPHAFKIDFENGTALLVETEDSIVLPEMLLKAEDTDRFLQAVQRAYPSKSVVYSVADTKAAAGMLLPLSDTAKQNIDLSKKVPFFGTFFDV